ncbi:MAG TPA: acyltransferase [Luteimonas sp.]|nr:acyltransferase [Luteimonas sp.]HRO27117.1 acyltransferase [Luteimonas sp.]HRP72396.1 acyltransferase [Luteimonas sp.]
MMLASFRHWAANSPHPVAQLIRAVHGRLRYFTLPAPRLLVRPYLWIFLAVRGVIFFLRRVLMAEPLFKAYCARFGRGVTTGIYVPWIRGRGELVVGDYVHVSGKLSIIFAARFVERPKLSIGDYTDLAHETSFVVGREIRLGSHVQVGGGVSFRDAGGHPTDPEQRRVGEPPDGSEVKSIIVHDNVWIGVGTLVLPGTEIGEGSIVAARSVVSGTVAPYTVVAGNPARRIGTLTPPPGREHLAPKPPPARAAHSAPRANPATAGSQAASPVTTEAKKAQQ